MDLKKYVDRRKCKIYFIIMTYYGENYHNPLRHNYQRSYSAVDLTEMLLIHWSVFEIFYEISQGSVE